jgi:hypothetical protein
MHHHKHRPIKEYRHPISVFGRMYRLAYLVTVLLSLLVIGTGVTTLARGRLGYYNYRHLIVFAPFSVVVGLGFLWVTLMLRKRAQLKPDTRTEPAKQI